MKRLIGVTVAVLLLTGCSGSTQQPLQPQPPSPSQPPAQSQPAPSQPPASPPPASAPITSLFMTDANQGWALGGGAIRHTGDAGATWQPVTPAGVTIPDHVASARGAACFLNADTGWVTVGDGADTKFVRTADGGKSWDTVAAPRATMGFLAFADTQHGWWLAHVDASMGSEAAELYGTRDGGKSWTLMARTAPSGQGDAGSLPQAGMKTGLTFRDASNGWVTAETPQPDLVWLYRTTDGGQTWRQQQVPVPAAFKGQTARTAAPHFFSPKEGILPITFVEGFETIFYRTTDGGETWAPTAPVKTKLSGNGVLLADFADPAHGWTSDGSVLYSTADGGRTWATRTPGQSLAGVQQFNFVSPQIGWAVVAEGPGTLLATTDGGATWTGGSLH